MNQKIIRNATYAYGVLHTNSWHKKYVQKDDVIMTRSVEILKVHTYTLETIEING